MRALFGKQKYKNLEDQPGQIQPVQATNEHQAAQPAVAAQQLSSGCPAAQETPDKAGPVASSNISPQQNKATNETFTNGSKAVTSATPAVAEGVTTKLSSKQPRSRPDLTPSLQRASTAEQQSLLPLELHTKQPPTSLSNDNNFKSSPSAAGTTNSIQTSGLNLLDFQEKAVWDKTQQQQQQQKQQFKGLGSLSGTSTGASAAAAAAAAAASHSLKTPLTLPGSDGSPGSPDGKAWPGGPWSYDEDAQGQQVGWQARLGRHFDALLSSQAVAVLFDMADVGLYFLDVITDIRVLVAFNEAGHTLWLYLSVWFITWHYVLMAGLVVGAVRRMAGHMGSYAYAEKGVSGVRQRSPLWLLSIPFALPAVVGLDLCMLVTSTLPLLVRQRGSSGISSFLSNYNFTQLFMEFVCESIPQTVLQTYILSQLLSSNMATKLDITSIALSLFVSCVNVVKYGWKLRKAARQAGMTLWEYSKYVLLLKGNYECSPSVLADQIAACTHLTDGTLLLDGFVLHRSKNTFGPAQQAYILMSSLEALQGRADVTQFVVSGCPLPCVNRLLQLGLSQFPALQLLELRESAFRGNTWRGVLEGLRGHACCRRLRVVQTGVFARYKKFSKEHITESFKPKYRLTYIGLCVPWWDSAMTAAAAKYATRPPTIQTAMTAAAATIPSYHHRTPVAGVSRRLISRALSRLAGGSAAAAAGPGSLDGFEVAAAAAAVGAVEQPSGVSVLALEYPRPSGGRGTSSAELSFLGKYSPCEVDLSAGTSLAGLITGSASLTSLSLHNQHLHPLGLSCMALAAARSSSLTHLSLRGSNVGDQGAIELARLLSCCPRLASLNLRGCNLHQEGGAALGAVLPQAATLEKLDISANRLAGPRCLSGLACGLRLCCGLKQLVMEEVDDLGQQVEGLSELCGALALNRHLCHLSLACSGITGPALAAMAAAGLAGQDVSCTDGKRRVVGASQRPTDAGLGPGDMMHSFHNSSASLTSVGKGDPYAAAGRIEEYEAAADDGDGDGGAGLVRLCFAWLNPIKPNTSLRELNLKGHPLPQPAAVALSQVIKQHPVLQILRLSDPFGLSGAALGVLCPAVAAAAALHTLELQRCGTGLGSRGPLGLEAARALASMIAAPGCHLTSLELSFSSFSAIWSVLAGALVCRKHVQREAAHSRSSSRAAADLQGTGGEDPPAHRQQQGQQQQRQHQSQQQRQQHYSQQHYSQQQQQQQHSCSGCRLTSLSLAHCGVPDSGAGALAAAMSSNVGLTQLDMSGFRQEAAVRVFRQALDACSVAAAPPQAVAAEAVGAGGGWQPVGCSGLRSFKVTGEQFVIVDLLAPLRAAAASAGSCGTAAAEAARGRSGAGAQQDDAIE